ncbi:MAG: hypothetical protein JRJ04_01480 [Deltaproteobacteria bacterium]|nr:hypothetical protein [Deltaproteobacteria bacterium]
MTSMSLESIARTISERREAFLSYNTLRLRELIRYLSPKKFELFHTIPFLLHVNLPEFPGYLDDSSCAHGIYMFNRSGFWRHALKQFRIHEDKVKKRQDIQGIYLMGSAGTIGQTEHSDFDYWLITDKSTLTARQRSLLIQKAAAVEKWSQTKYNHKVKFFFLMLINCEKTISPLSIRKVRGPLKKRC